MRVCLALLLGFLLLTAPAHADEAADAAFRDGMAAYEAKDYKRAMAVWLPLAEAGHAEAQFRVGRLYHLGEGIPKEPLKALEWYSEVAKTGHLGAEYNIGHIYEHGTGVNINKETAVSWYIKAADMGDMESQLAVGMILSETDKSASQAWLWKAADQGSRVALVMLDLQGDELAKAMTTWKDFFCVFVVSTIFHQPIENCPF